MTLSAVDSMAHGARAMSWRADAATRGVPTWGLHPVGRAISQVLWRFWDEERRATPSADELARATPVLLAHGMGAFAQRRTRPIVQGIHGVGARSEQQRLKQAIASLERERIRCLLGVGTGCAPLYPEPGLRALDPDLIIEADDLARAQRAVGPGTRIELRPLAAEAFAPLYEQATTRVLDDLEARCLAPEDELRLALLQVQQQGSVKPIWLCDVALLLERGRALHDRERVLAASAWNACVIQLARDVLGARPPAELAEAIPTERVPAWVERALLAGWGRPASTLDRPAFAYVRKPQTWLNVVRDRIPDPIAVNARAGVSPRCSTLRAGFSVAFSVARELARLVFK
ncbi:MAG TPA: hypothetical protein VI299_13705 [Polyangiales bacterium]